MPYPNMPKSKWAAMEKCVREVKAKNPGKNAYAICYISLMHGKKTKHTDDSDRKWIESKLKK